MHTHLGGGVLIGVLHLPKSATNVHSVILCLPTQQPVQGQVCGTVMLNFQCQSVSYIPTVDHI